MTAKGLDVFDKTIQTAHIWLKEINEVIGPDPQLAWKVLSVVLQKLRDRMPVELSAHLSAELPLIIRGVYYDQFTPSRQPTDWNREAFVAEVARGFSEIRPVDPQDASARSSWFCRATFRKGRSRRCNKRCRKICASCGSCRGTRGRAA